MAVETAVHMVAGIAADTAAVVPADIAVVVPADTAAVVPAVAVAAVEENIVRIAAVPAHNCCYLPFFIHILS